MVPKWLMALWVLLQEAWSTRRDAHRLRLNARPCQSVRAPTSCPRRPSSRRNSPCSRPTRARKRVTARICAGHRVSPTAQAKSRNHFGLRLLSHVGATGFEPATS